MRRQAAARCAVLAILALPGAAAAQRVARAGNCLLDVEYVGRTGAQVVMGKDSNYYAGGGVRLSCRGAKITMQSDSLASYGGRIVEFIGKVKYRDSVLTLDADRGTYYKEGEKWEARGNVRTRNRKSGSTLEGPSVDYLRSARGYRDTTEMFAVGRPTIRYLETRDSAPRPADATSRPGKSSADTAREPYVIVGDRVHLKGDDRIWAGGKVTVDRSDLAARGDSLRLDTITDDATLIGTPSLKGLGTDTFTVTGTQIDLKLRDRDVERIWARGDGHAVSSERDITGDTLDLALRDRRLRRIVAWGKKGRPHALADKYEVRADSVIFETPGQRLEEVRAYRKAWVGAEKDAAGERDWISGDSVLAFFRPKPGRDSTKSTLERLESDGDARTFYRNNEPGKDGKRPAKPTLAYTRGTHITVRMRAPKPGADEGVERVEVRGKVDGIQLEPAKEKRS